MSKQNKVGTNLFGKGQRVISDAYREGWERTFGKKSRCDECDKCKNEDEKA
jgi:hypothetical protein